MPYFAKETLGVAIGRIAGYERLHRLGTPSPGLVRAHDGLKGPPDSTDRVS